METQWLIDRLENPRLLEKGDEKVLREMIAEWPWFPAPYLLLGKALNDQQHPAYEELLPLISLQAQNRKLLFGLIHESAEAGTENPVITDSSAGIIPSTQPDFPEETESESATEHEEETLDVAKHEDPEAGEEVTEQAPPVAEESIELEATPLEEIGEEPQAVTETEHITEEPDLETGSTEAGIPEAEESAGEAEVSAPGRFTVDFGDIEKEETEIHEENRPEELPEISFRLRDIPGQENPMVQPEPEPETHPEPVSEPESQTDILPESTDVSGPVEEKAESEDTEIPAALPADFFHWLDRVDRKEQEEKIQRQTEEESVVETVSAEENELVPESTESVEESVKAEEGIDVPEDNPDLAVIDRFLELQPSITRVKGEFYNPVNQARESEQFDDAFATETMARIFTQQGKFDKAIAVYEKLQLKLPEKSDYFAALIAELKEKDN